jgi:hypothetical protein
MMSFRVRREKRPSPAAGLLTLTCLLIASPKHGQAGPAPRPARPHAEVFAIVVGVNQAHDRSVTRLRFADDDALAFHRIFSALGSSNLLTNFDRGTRRLHPKQRATRPTRVALLATIRRTLAQVSRARARGANVQLYFVYSGHGDTKNNAGFLVLSGGGRFSSTDLARLLAASRANVNHVIVDACDSYYLVREKRAGGQRQATSGRFHRPRTLLRRFPKVGFILSTAGASASHEWARYQAGIFSHEVRSALLGAADVDGDAKVSYGELRTFLHVANRAIRNDRYRPRVFVRPPAADPRRPLLELPRKGRLLRLPAGTAGRYYLETSDGVRLADFHVDGKTPLTVWRPSAKRLFVHDMLRRREYTLDGATPPSTVVLRQLDARPRSYARKGAAQEAFQALFAEPHGLAEHQRLLATLPFDEPALAREADPGDVARADSKTSGTQQRLSAGYLLRLGYLDEASALHGVALGYQLWFGRLGLGATAAYGASRYQRKDRGLAVRYDDVQLGVRIGLRVLQLGPVAIDVGAEGTLGWGFQRADGPTGETWSTARPVFGYRGQVGIDLQLTRALGLRAELLAGQLFFSRDDSLSARARLGGVLGLSWTL